jgi:hypothetical protein
MRQRTGLLTDEQLKAAAGPLIAPILAGGRYPALARWVREHTATHPAGGVEYTLGCLLDGIAARLTG